MSNSLSESVLYTCIYVYVQLYIYIYYYAILYKYQLDIQKTVAFRVIKHRSGP
jgi:hypothetical protein